MKILLDLEQLQYDTGTVSVEDGAIVVGIDGHRAVLEGQTPRVDLPAGFAGSCPYPESAARIDPLYRAVLGLGRADGVEFMVLPEAADPRIPQRCHTMRYVRSISERRVPLEITHETVLTPATFDQAARAAAGCAALAAYCMNSGKSAFSLARPPGHHAGRDHAAGYCVFNNAAIAAASARLTGAERVFIWDWDLHHGDGTQEIFWKTDKVFYCSVHADSRLTGYPKGGGDQMDKRGEGPGEGFTLNLPLPLGVTPDEYLAVTDEVVLPAARAFRPDAVIVSAGFDGHTRGLENPLLHTDRPGFELDAETFGRLAARAWALGEVSGSRPLFILEGGYGAEANRDSALAMIRTIVALERGAASEAEGPRKAPRPEVARRIEAARAAFFTD